MAISPPDKSGGFLAYIFMTEFNIEGAKYQIVEPSLEGISKTIIYKEKGVWPFKKKVPIPKEELVDSCRQYILKNSTPKLDIYTLRIEVATPILEALFAKILTIEDRTKVGLNNQPQQGRKKKAPSYIG